MSRLKSVLTMCLQLIGPPGVGKTAILEGLASRIVAKEVPEVSIEMIAPIVFFLMREIGSLSKTNAYFR